MKPNKLINKLINLFSNKTQIEPEKVKENDIWELIRKYPTPPVIEPKEPFPMFREEYEKKKEMERMEKEEKALDAKGKVITAQIVFLSKSQQERARKLMEKKKKE